MNEKLESLIPTLPGWCSIAKAKSLYSLVIDNKAKTVVEIGTFAARAGVALATACKETGGQYIGIDPYTFKASLEGKNNPDHDKYWTEMDYDEMKLQAVGAFKEMGVQGIVKMINKSSREAWKEIKELPDSIDIVYIDGNTSPEGTMLDVELYCALVKQGGYVVMNNSDWTTKSKAKRRILEIGFVEVKQESDEDKCIWTTYKRGGAKVEVAPKHPVDEISMEQPGWGTQKQCMALYNLVKETKAKVTIDIGVFGGRFLSAMALAHKENGFGVCYGIDPWEGVACTEGTNDKENDDWWTDPDKVDFKALHRDVVELMIKHDLTDHSNILRFKSSEVWPLFSQIDICSIDGNHSEEISCQDVATWAPLVKEGGYIHFDDANWPTTQKAQELILNYGFEQICFIEEGDGRDWKLYRKLGSDNKIDVTKIIAESKKDLEPVKEIIEEVEIPSVINIEEPKEEPMKDSPMESGFVDQGKAFPIYDHSKRQPRCPIPPIPFDIALRGGMQIGPLQIQPMLLYIPDSPYWVDRWKKGMKHFEERGLKNIIEIPGIHGVGFGIQGIHTYDIDNPGTGFNIGPGYTAQYLSVYMMYVVASILPSENYMFLECDAELVPDYLHHLSRELENVPPDFDFIFVGSCCLEGKLHNHVKGNVYELTPSTGYGMCGHNYIINRKCLPYVIETQNDCYASSDINLIFNTFPNLKVYAISPRLSTQNNTDLPR